jgi:predicted nucleic acid-binding protein
VSAAFVVDCSITMTWLFEDEVTPETEDLYDRLMVETAVVPTLWFLEVANVIAIAERKSRITPGQSMGFIADLAKLRIEQDDQGPSRAFSNLLLICRTHQLTSYDALYLDLAVRRGLPLATLDEPLRKAAKKLGVAPLGK